MDLRKFFEEASLRKASKTSRQFISILGSLKCAQHARNLCSYEKSYPSN